MTLAQLRDKADARLATFWTALVAKEQAYFAKHGRYFQLLLSPETKVVDGADSNFTIRYAPNESFVLDVDFAWTDLVPFNLEVQEYNKGDRQGFTASVWASLPNGNVYTRSRTYENVPNAPQSPLQTDTGWSQYIVEDLGLTPWLE